MADGYNFGQDGPYYNGQMMLPHRFPPDPSGKSYYVDANVAAAGDGSSWDEAFSLIASGLAAADTQIGLSANRAWARRNTVYYCGDYISEALVLAAEKTDLIGVGSDGGSFPRVVGNFTIGTAVQSFRIINMGFMPTSTSPGITFPSGMHGWEMHYVTIFKNTSYTCSAQLLSTDSRGFIMDNVRILPDNAGALSTIGFNIAGTTYGVGQCKITNCEIHGTEGMNVVDTSAYYEGAICKNTLFKATNLAVDENSDSILFVDCRFVTAAAAGDANGVGIVDIEPANLVACEAVSSDSWGPIPNLNALS